MKRLDRLSIFPTNPSRPQRVLAHTAKAGTAVLALSVLLAGSTAQAQTRPQERTSDRALEPLIGRRVLVVLPLQTSQNWVANRIFTQAILPETQRRLERALTIQGAIQWPPLTASTRFCSAG
jgi:hypothetical protein